MSEESPDVVVVLEHDHREVEDMFARYEALPLTETEERKKVADAVIIELIRHAVAEEQHLYPAVKKVLPNGEELAGHELREHAEAEETMNALDRTSPDDAEFDVLMRRLMEQIRHHVAEEEGTLFPQLRSTCSAEKLRELGGKIEMAKKLAPTRPHPMAPDTPPFNKLLGPGTALVDRVRDFLSGRGAD